MSTPRRPRAAMHWLFVAPIRSPLLLMARLDKIALIKDGALSDFGPAAAVLARAGAAPARASAPVLAVARSAAR